MSAPAPWDKGSYPTYDAFVIEVGVRKDRTGGWRSYHRLQDARDAQVAGSFGAGQGMEEAVFALVSEAVRTEALLQLIILMSNDLKLQETLKTSEEVPGNLVEDIEELTQKQVGLVLEKIVSSLVKETIEQVHNGLRQQPMG